MDSSGAHSTRGLTVFIPTRHRVQHMDALVSRVLDHGVGRVIVWDDSNRYAHPQLDKVTVIRSSVPIGSCVKFRASQLAQTPYYCALDDDIWPLDGFFTDLMSWHSALGGVVSIFGRRFAGKYKGSPVYRGSEQDSVVAVDFIGQCYLGYTGHFAADMAGCHDGRLDDLYWSWKMRQAGRDLFVVPSKRYEYRNELVQPQCGTDGYWKLRNDFVVSTWGSAEASHGD